MQVIRHLSHAEMLDLQLDSDRQALASELTALRDWTSSVAEQPEDFWQRQRAGIRQRIGEEQAAAHAAGWRLAWGAALALLFLATMLLNSGTAPAPVAKVQAAQDPDQQLLMSVQETVSSDVPEALAPASLLVEEISQSVPTNSASAVRNKETSNEN